MPPSSIIAELIARAELTSSIDDDALGELGHDMLAALADYTDTPQHLRDLLARWLRESEDRPSPSARNSHDEVPDCTQALLDLIRPDPAH
jgi:hypothetical protein